MSYKCQHTGEIIPSGIRQFKVITERRQKEYTVEIKYGHRKGEYEIVTGWEIAKELIVGPKAYTELTGLPTGDITSKSIAVSKNAVTKEDNTRPYEPWKKKTNYQDRNDRRPQVDRVNRPYNNKR